MRIVCPTCKKLIENAPPDFPPRPFCSARCKLVDLGNWLDGVYRISEPLEEVDGNCNAIEANRESPEKHGRDRDDH